MSLRPLWISWHLLSLDAPSVAALWSCLFARVVHVRLPWADTAVLAGTVWLIYTADRLLDGWRATSPERLRLRHHFARRQRAVLTAAWLLILPVVAWIALFRIDRVLFGAGMRLLAVVLLYFCAVHLAPRALSSDWMKRALVGIVFSAGALLPAWTHASAPGPLVLPGAAFATLCFLNCTAIETWEGGQRHRVFRCAMAISACLLALLSAAPFIAAGRMALLACAISACGLTCLDAARDRLSTDAVRVLADVALLTAAVSLGPA